MRNLTSTIKKIERSSEKPEKDYGLIFKNEAVYVGMLKTLNQAYKVSFRLKLKLFEPRRLDAIQEACRAVGLPYKTKQQLSNVHRRNSLVEELKRRSGPNGMNGYDYLVHLVQIRALTEIEWQTRKKEVEKMALSC